MPARRRVGESRITLPPPKPESPYSLGPYVLKAHRVIIKRRSGDTKAYGCELSRFGDSTDRVILLTNFRLHGGADKIPWKLIAEKTMEACNKRPRTSFLHFDAEKAKRLCQKLMHRVIKCCALPGPIESD